MSQAQETKTRNLRSVFARLALGVRRPAMVNDFHGGIHPPERKDLSNGTEITAGPLPAQLVLPLNMHIGAPAKPLVEPGDRVLKGQMIAEPAGAVSAAIHAPTSGTVSAIGLRPIQHPSGMDALCIVLDTDGKDEWIAHSGIQDYTELSPGELVDTIRHAVILRGEMSEKRVAFDLRNQAKEALVDWASGMYRET